MHALYATEIEKKICACLGFIFCIELQGILDLKIIIIFWPLQIPYNREYVAVLVMRVGGRGWIKTTITCTWTKRPNNNAVPAQMTL